MNKTVCKDLSALSEKFESILEGQSKIKQLLPKSAGSEQGHPVVEESH